MKFKISVRTNIFRWFPASPTYSHLAWYCLLKSRYIVHMVFAKHTQLWNRDSLSYGMESEWCTLHCMQALFRAVTITGVVVRGFRSSSVPVTHEGYLVESHRPLWFGPHKPIALSLTTLSRHSALATVSRSTSIISLCLGSSASLSSQTNRSVFSTLSRDSPVGDSQPLSW